MDIHRQRADEWLDREMAQGHSIAGLAERLARAALIKRLCSTSRKLS
jgi:hypothetical protein